MARALSRGRVMAMLDPHRNPGRRAALAPLRKRRKLPWLLVAAIPMLTLLPVVLLAGAGNPCTAGTAVGAPAAGGVTASGGFEETAYGPPWDAMNGSGQTAYGPNLTAGQPALVIAIDPAVLTPRAYYHVWPNPFATHGAFLA